ncbi:DNA-binding PadR family transcriptional regulator [Kribbella sp. VKM Ac-2571]|uniref:PadR family transcriptional regulator n=1 Tax=Kribbella sp. VKM Ac-2571 TaxID=2512222 RepID=UPI001060E57B|nr:PadR family transcriptional regulator [Kribbella sp. VKM Ac-2571]TDO67194.1 DNA-binding PadR family transcriptional regulator [Kribbella sp. VKM Ac-2571]
MARRKVANPLAFAVLGSLSERPMHPYEISTMLRARGKDQSIKVNYGSLYSVVAALEKHGFVEALETVREGNRPERTVYQITDAGSGEFRDWLAELVGTPAREFHPLEAGLAYLPGLPPDRAVELLEQRLKAVDTEISEIIAAHDHMASMEFPRIFWVESEFRLALLQAESAYVHQLVEEIRTDALGGSRFWRQAWKLYLEEGISPVEQLKDPVKYFGQEFAWMQAIPPEAR